MRYKNLIVIGTSHIARQSLEDVKNAIEQNKPGIVALELDKKRAVALSQKSRGKGRISLYGIRKVGVKGFIFSLIGAWVENKLGKHVGVMPGSEMLEAMKLAKKNNIKVALIDQDIEVTLKRFSKALSWKERWHFIVDLFKGLVLRKKEKITFDLTKVPEKKLIKKLIGIVKKRYPNIYRVLVEERNEVMAKRLAVLMKRHPDAAIVAVVGAGHEEEIIDMIKKRLNKIDVSYSFTIS